MDVWNEWIGSSPTRTLIAMECKAVAELNKALERGGTKNDPADAAQNACAPQQLDWPPADHQHFYLYPVPNLEAAVMWIGGRSFLVGAPKGAHEMLLAHGDLPDNIILLSWALEHTAGLPDFWRAWDQKKPADTQLRIWTSDWVWEHLVEAGTAPSEMSRENTEVLQSFDQRPRIARTTFESEYAEHFAPRVELSLTYGVGEVHPQLFAHFRFFDSHLIMALQQAAPETSSPVGLPKVANYQRLISEIYRAYPQSRTVLTAVVEKRLKQLCDAEVLGPLTRERRSWWYRYSLRLGAIEQLIRPGGEDPEGPCCPQVQPLSRWMECFADATERSIDAGGAISTASFENESMWNRELFRAWAGQTNRPRDAALPDPPLTSTGSCCTREVSLVIGCGAPPTRWQGQLTPDRRLVLGERDVSALEAKLLQLAALPQIENPVFTKTVYLLVSPATEDLVRNELSRIRRDHTSQLEGVQFEILRDRVIPRYECVNQSLHLFRQRDGGFQYNPAGHLQVIWCLHRAGYHGLFYYTNLTNMGINVTNEVDVLRQHMAATGSAAVFELVLHEEHKEGIGPGSYWVANADDNALIKPVYLGCEREGRHTWPHDRDAVVQPNGNLYMSTGSVLLDMAEFQGPQFQMVAAVPHFARPRRPLRTRSRDLSDDQRWTVQLERDLDQITWIKGVKCSGVVLQQADGARRRFFAVKQESDLYQKSYEELSRLYCGLTNFCALAPPTPIPNTPLALVGAEQHDPWGDGLLRHLKGAPRSDVDVSETWESSAYPKGLSLVEKNALETVSLREAMPDLAGRMNVMGKLLDCAGSLSIQVHPSDRVCKALRNAGREIEDDVGKEENFFVVRATGERLFYLGFDAQKVTSVFGFPGAVVGDGDPFQKVVEERRDEIDHFGTQALGILETPFSTLLLETLGNGPVTAQAILDLRRNANSEQQLTDEALAGILFIMALKTLTRVVSGNRPLYLRADANIDHLRTFALQYLNKVDGIRSGTIIHVPPGVIHAAGPGCFLVEASGQSDNTFRIFDHGREYEPEARPMHYEHAAVALSEDSFLDKTKQRRLVNPGVVPSDATLRMVTEKVEPRSRSGAAAHKHASASFPCDDPETHGHTLICTGGRLLVSADLDGKPSRVVSVGQAHSLFLLPGAGQLSVLAAGHDVSFYSLFCSQTKPVSPRLAIAIGGTHFQFVYRAYPDPPRCDTHLWYNLLAKGTDFSWHKRLSCLQSELSRFLNSVPKVSLCALSWPGTILGTGNQATLTAHILDCGGATLQDLVKDAAVDTSDCRILFDADADLAAELKEVGGQLQGKSGNPLPGWLLNFSSEVSMSVASTMAGSRSGASVAEVTSTIPNPRGQKLIVRRIGRMLWFDPMSRDWNLTDDSMIQPQSAPEGLPPRVIRLRDMLSTTGVALRLLSSGLGEKFLSDFSEKNYATELWKCWVATQEVPTCDRSEKITKLILEFRPHLNAAIADIFTWLDEQPDRGEFVEEIGRDYGDVIAALLAELPVLQSTRVAVLGGFGGSHFGKKGERFLKAVSGQLHAGNRFRETEVRRATSSSLRFRLLHAPDWGDLFS